MCTDVVSVSISVINKRTATHTMYITAGINLLCHVHTIISILYIPIHTHAKVSLGGGGGGGGHSFPPPPLLEAGCPPLRIATNHICNIRSLNGESVQIGTFLTQIIFSFALRVGGSILYYNGGAPVDITDKTGLRNHQKQSQQLKNVKLSLG